MSRNASAHDAAEESFAGLLEHMTRNSRAPMPDLDFETRYTPRNGAASDSNPPARAVPGAIASNTLARPAARAMAPAVEVKPSLDGAPLSYENALRRHARYHSSTESLELPALDPAKVTEANTNTSSREAGRKIRAARSKGKAVPAQMGNGAREPGLRSPTTREASLRESAKASHARSPRLKTHAEIEDEPASIVGATSAALRMENNSTLLAGAVKPQAAQSGMPTAKSATRTKGEQKNSTTGRQRKSNAGGTQGRQAARYSQAMSDSPRAANAESRNKASAMETQRSANSRPDLHPDRSTATRRPSVRRVSESISIENNTVLESSARPLENCLATLKSRTMEPARGMELAVIDQKRSTVSVRLTDAEFQRLKERAGESGISVSAYMRSCVLDADQLRAQVKQALAEMRALTARPDPEIFHALPSPERSVSVRGGDWFRVIVRSAAFLLSPLFPFRRSA